MLKRWLVLGGTGLVGRRLVRALVARGDYVDVVTRGARALPTGAKSIVADIFRRDWIDSLTAYDVVCHLAYAATGDDAYDRAVTLDSVLALLQRSSQMGVTHFIYLGSMAIFGENTPVGTLDETAPKLGKTEYARNKIAATNAVMSALGNFRVSVLHPTGVYDPSSTRITSYKAMLKMGYIDVPLTGLNNIVHAEDMASAIILCADRRLGSRREEYIINGEVLSYSDWIGHLERQLGLASRLKLPRYVSMFCRGPLGTLVRRLQWRRGIKVPAYKAALYCLKTCFSSAKALRDFGYRPSRAFIEEIKADECEY